MKWFWGILLLLAVGAAIALMRGGGGGGGERAASGPAAGAAATTTGKSSESAVVPKPPTPAQPQPSAAIPSQPTAPSAPTNTPPAPLQDAPPPTPSHTDDATHAAPSPPAASTPHSPVPAAAAPSAIEAKAQQLNDGLSKALGLTDETPAPAPDMAAAHEMVGPPAPGRIGAAATAGAPLTNAPADSAKAKLVEQPDGSVLVDDKYVVKGLGTQDDPFIVSWEMLLSAQDTYQPRLGRKVIPDRLKMLNGKWVKIAGFVAFPIMAATQDEMLMMLNQWDGCCIGVPPTPFDAIEVKLKSAAEGDDRLRVSGTIKGILRVDPYLIKDWLVSLYLMDDAQFLPDDQPAPKRDPAAIGAHGAGGPADAPQ